MDIQELIPWSFLYTVLRRCGPPRRCPPVISGGKLIRGLVFNAVAEAGTLAQLVKALSGKSITDGALAQRRARFPLGTFEALMKPTIRPKSDPQGHREAFF